MVEEFLTFIAGDIGGTNARFALKKISRSDKTKREVIKEEKLCTENHDNFEDAVNFFLKDYKGKDLYPKHLCLGIAGPRRGNKIKITNARWPEFDIDEAKKNLGFESFHVLNDFEANGYGILNLTPEMYLQVNKAECQKEKPMILIGTGTGLGEAILTKSPTDKNYVVYPGEGGHVDFSPRNETEFGFMMLVKKKLKLDRVSYERCCCGLAIPIMYFFLHEESKKEGTADSEFHLKIKADLETLMDLLENKSEDDSINNRVHELNKQIMSTGLAKTDKVCEKTVELFASLYGAETGFL